MTYDLSSVVRNCQGPAFYDGPLRRFTCTGVLNALLDALARRVLKRCEQSHSKLFDVTTHDADSLSVAFNIITRTGNVFARKRRREENDAHINYKHHHV